MVASEKFLQDIRQQLADGDIQRALDRLQQYLHDKAPQLEDDVILYSGRYNRLQSEERKGTIARDAFRSETTKLTQNILEFLKELMKKSKTETACKPTQESLTRKSHYSYVQLILESEIHRLDETTHDNLIRLIAAQLNIEPQSIRILRVAPGSTLIIIKLPQNAAPKLADLFKTNKIGRQLLNRFPVKSIDIVNIDILDSLRGYEYTQEEWYAPKWPKMTKENYEKFRKDFQPDILLMTATATELRQVLKVLKPPLRKRQIRHIETKSQTYYIGKFGEFPAVVVKSEMGAGGPAGAFGTATDAINDWKPKALIMVGIAFGADRGKHQPADVLIADKIVSYEKQRVGEKAIFRDAIPPVGLVLLNRFKNALGWSFQRPDGTKVQCHSGAILSGEKLIDDPAFKKELIDQFPQAIGGEMEGAGVYAAAARAKIEWILVKGVCDWADGRKHDGYQEMAAAAATSLVHSVLSSENALNGL